MSGKSRPETLQRSSLSHIRDLETRLAALHTSSDRANIIDALLNAIDNTLVVTDPNEPDNPIIYINQGFEKITGYRPEEVIGHNCRFLQGDDRDQPAVKEIREAVREGRAVQVELRNYRKDGSMFWNELYLSPVYDEAGKLVLFVGVQNDVTARAEALEELRRARDTLEERVKKRTRELNTSNESLEHEVGERRRAEEEVRASEERLQDVLDHLLTFVAVLSPEGRLRYVNHTALHISEVTPDEVLGEPFADTPWWRHDPAVQARLRGALQRAAAGETLRYDERVWVGEGRVLTVDFMLAPMTDGRGRVTHLAASAVDITERKLAEGALSESQRFLRSTLDALGAHIAVLDEEGTIIATNAAWRRFAEENGGNPDDLGTNYLAVCGVPPDGADMKVEENSVTDSDEGLDVAAGIQAVIGGEKERFRLEYPCHSPTQKRWFALTVSRFSGPGPVRVVVAHENISERKLAEEALQGATERLRLLVESAKEYAIIMTDGEGRVLEWNPGAERIIGYSEGEVLGQKVDFIFTPEDRDEGRPAFELRKAEETGAANDQRWHLKKDGTRFFADGVMTALRDDEGHLRGFAKVLRDSTERELAEEALRKSEERYRTLFTTIDQGFGVLEMVCGDDGEPEDYRFLETNPAFEQHTGLVDAAGKRARELVPDLEEHWIERYNRVVVTDEPLRFESSSEVMGRTFDVYATPVSTGENRKVAVLFTDVTERKRAEEALRRSEEQRRVALASATMGTWDLDLVDNVLFMDERCRELFNVPEEGAVRLEEPLSHIHPEERDMVAEAIVQATQPEADGNYDREYRVLKPDGGVRWVRATGRTLFEGEHERRPVRFGGVVMDTTERKLAEAALRKSEEEHRTLFETMTQGIVYQNAHGEITSVNPAAARMLGLSTDEATGRVSADPRWRTLREDGSPFPSEEHPPMVALRTGRIVNDVVAGVYNPKDGAHRWMSLDAVPQFRPGEKKPYQVYSLFDDITWRKKAEAALRESEMRFRGTFENAAVGIGHVGMGGEWLRVNGTLCKITGYSKDELLKMTFQDITHPDDLNADLVQFEELMKGEINSYTMEKRYFHADGHVVWIDLTTALQRDPSGEPEYCISVVEDISKRKEAERERSRLLELERSAREEAERAGARLTFLAEASTLLASSLDYEETLANVAKLAVPGVADWCTVDLVDEHGRLERLAVAHKDPDKVAWALELNRRYPPAPHTPGGFYEVLRTGKAVLRPEVPDALLKAAAQDDAHLKLLRAVGFRSMMVVPLNVHDKTLGVLLFVSAEGGRRYTETDLALAEELGRRAAIAVENALLYAQAQDLNEALEERVAQRTAQLEAANKELEAFSYSVSHDLRAPLRGIDGFSQALLEDYTEGLDETARHYLGRVRAGAQRMGELIDDLLLLSRLSRSEMKRQEVHLSGIVEEISQRLVERDPRREASFDIQKNVTAEGDARLLTVVLENLLENAWKFTAREAVTHVHFGMQGGEIPVYFVGDNGAGFNMAYANKLFTAFQRLHSPQEFEGTGIGLATVQRIIHRHGGKVWAEGEVGAGATFFFTLV